jgi:hypothetical protein
VRGWSPSHGRIETRKNESIVFFLAFFSAQKIDGDSTTGQEHQGPGSGRRLFPEIADSTKLMGDDRCESNLKIMFLIYW